MLRPLLPLLLLLLACDDDPRLRAASPRQESVAEPERGPEVAPTCTAPGPCYTAAYEADIEACVGYPLPDGTACTGPCLEDASCRAGHCEGAPRSCDDGNVCTHDACVAGTCENLGVACAAPEDPCLAAVCDPETGCGAAPVPDGVRCGVQGCDTREVCMAGKCTEVEAMDGDACDGICTVGICTGGSCAEPEVVERSWYVSTGRALYDEVSRSLIAIEEGALNRVHRDGSIEQVSYEHPQPRLSAVTANLGMAAGRWYWEDSIDGLRTTGIDGQSSWHLEEEDEPSPGLVVRTILSDGTVVARSGPSLWRIGPDGQVAFLLSLCTDNKPGQTMIDVLADENDALHISWTCDGKEATRLASLHGTAPLQPLLWQPPGGSYCWLDGAFAGRLVVNCEGQPLVLVDVETAETLDLGDGWLGALTADTVYVRYRNSVRAIRIEDGAELWSRSNDESWPGCTPDWCRPAWLGHMLPLRSGSTLLYTQGRYQPHREIVPRWVLEIRSDGTIARTCRLRDYGGYSSPRNSWFVDGMWLDLGNDYYGLEAFELSGNPQLAPGWSGSDGGPAGGNRPWSL